MATPKIRLWWAHLETRNYEFDAFGLTEAEALAELKAGWRRHRLQSGATMTWSELVEGGDVNAMEIETHTCYIDRHRVE